jgi:alginate O-acetyltransferase complex protein AlgI
MAIGIGHMLGFSYPPNFKQPYSSTSVTEFWRRWHISLSSWFRDYLYIPLGGNRGSPARTYLNLAIVFLLCGLWHGAAWTFVVWGGWHGALLVMERMGLGRLLARLPAAVAQAYTLFAVMIGWVFFRADSIPHAIDFLGILFGRASNGAIVRPWQMDVDAAAGVALVIGAALSLRRLPNESHPTIFSPLLKAATAVTTVVVCVASLAAGTYNPFIYFRF